MSAVLSITTRSVEETLRLAGDFAEQLAPSAIVALRGELGAGKSRFVEGACRALGYAGRVRSPSFTLLNIYRGRGMIYHFDLYRWDPGRGAFERAEWSELMEGEGISFVEWADRWGGEWPSRHWRVELRHRGESCREIRFTQERERIAALRARLVRWLAP